MSLLNKVNNFGASSSNWGTPGAAGTSLTPGTSGAEGTYAQIHSALGFDGWGIWIRVVLGNTSTQAKLHLLDIGYDPAGGTSWTTLINNILCGGSGNNAELGFFFYFPIRIPAGSTVAARVQGGNATPGTVRVATRIFGKPSRPDLVYAGCYSESIGTITSSNGVSFTPGTSNAEGTYVSLGTTTKRHQYWQLCVQSGDSTANELNYYWDLAYGDGSNKVLIIEDLPAATISSNERFVQTLACPGHCFCDLPAGTELFVRGSCSGTPDGNWGAVAIGIGG